MMMRNMMHTRARRRRAVRAPRPIRAITVRNIPDELARRLAGHARERGVSLNRAVIELLAERLGLSGRPVRERAHHDLDALAGSWTAEAAAEFDRHLKGLRQIDREIWPAR